MASWTWPVTTAIVGMFSLGWFLLGILVGRRIPRRNGKPQSQPQQGRQRREQQNQKPSSGSGAVELYVGNLSYEMTDAELRDLFGKHGKVVSIRLIENKFNGKSKGYGFLEMGDRGQAQAAMRALNGKEIQGRKIVVSEAKSKSRND